MSYIPNNIAMETPYHPVQRRCGAWGPSEHVVCAWKLPQRPISQFFMFYIQKGFLYSNKYLWKHGRRSPSQQISLLSLAPKSICLIMDLDVPCAAFWHVSGFVARWGAVSSAATGRLFPRPISTPDKFSDAWKQMALGKGGTGGFASLGVVVLEI